MWFNPGSRPYAVLRASWRPFDAGRRQMPYVSVVSVVGFPIYFDFSFPVLRPATRQGMFDFGILVLGRCRCTSIKKKINSSSELKSAKFLVQKRMFAGDQARHLLRSVLRSVRGDKGQCSDLGKRMMFCKFTKSKLQTNMLCPKTRQQLTHKKESQKTRIVAK